MFIRFCIALLLAHTSSAYAAESWKQLISDNKGIWYVDANSMRYEDGYKKLTLKYRLEAPQDIPIKDKARSETRTVSDVKEIVSINAVECSRRLSSVTAYTMFDSNGKPIGGGSGTKEEWVSKLKEPPPGTTMAKVVEAVCSARPAGNSAAQGAAPPPTASQNKQPTDRPPPRGSENRSDGSTGTGVVINSTGNILTNEHVVSGCKTISVYGADRRNRPAELIGTDRRNDLAVLATDPVGLGVGVSLRINQPLRSGENLMAIGFPLSGILSTEPNVSFGYVAATAGIADDSSVFQLSAPIHKGNSGGPVLDQSGQMIGVVKAKLNAAKIAELAGDLPQNIAFAVKADLVQLFLRSKNIPFTTAGSRQPQVSNPELAGKGKAVVVQVMCAR